MYMKSESPDGVTSSINTLSNKINAIESAVSELSKKLVDFVRPIEGLSCVKPVVDCTSTPKSNIEATIELFCARCEEIRAIVENISFSIHP